MYAIDETALHRSVTLKKNAASRRINRVETTLTLVNTTVTIILFVMAIQGHPLLFLNATVFAFTVVYVQYFRWKRKKAENTFDRSMLGELDQTISNTNSIITFNYFIVIYLTVLAIVTVFQMIARMDSWGEWGFIIASFLLAFFLVRREQKVRNIPGKEQLLNLKKNLTEECDVYCLR